jgi:uncharacterized protein (TIGR00369 family)
MPSTITFMTVNKEVVIKAFEEAVPIHRFLGVKVLALEEGHCKMLFPYREEVLGDARLQRWHGGLIATALDSVGGAAAATTLHTFEDKLATIDLRVDYLRGTTASDLVVTGKVIRSGNRIVACDMEAWQENEQKLVSTGRAMFSVYRQPKAPEPHG